jgi:glycoside/pentoside/hexuronide:cation symporter, GPH family
VAGGAPEGQRRLPLRTRVLYSSSSLGGEAITQSRGAWLVYYYAPPEDADLDALLPIGVVGALLFAANLVEALDDPLIGYWSDRTRSRLGRRLPFILTATPIWALAAYLLFTPPESAGPALTGAYLFLILELHHLCSTLSGGPYEALLPEIARTTRDRLSIVGIRVYFGAAGGAVGLVGGGLLVDRSGFEAMALTMALIALTFRYLGTAGVWSRARRAAPPATIPLRDSLRMTLSNRYFLLFLPTFVLFQVGLQMLLGVLPFYVTALLGPGREGTWVAIITATALGTTLAVVPLFTRLARRTSKRQAYRAAMLAAAVAFPMLSLAGLAPGIPAEAQIVVLMAAAGAPIAGIYLFPAALTADIIDYDTVRTGLRREASYFGTQNLVEKTATSVSPLLLALLLLLGDSADDPLGIRLVGPAAGAIVLVGYLVFRRYDLADEVIPEPGPGRPGAGRDPVTGA